MQYENVEWSCSCEAEYDEEKKIWYVVNFCAEHDPTIEN